MQRLAETRLLTHGACSKDGHCFAGRNPSSSTGMDAIAEGLDHGALLVADLIWQRKAEVLRVINIRCQAAVDGRRRKELYVWTEVVPALPADPDGQIGS